jgi:hypothetical protein
MTDGASLQGGSITADLVTQGSMDKLVITGMVGIYHARLAGFDLGTKIADDRVEMSGQIHLGTENHSG